MGVLERERIENDAEEIFKETMAEKFLKLMKTISLQIQETEVRQCKINIKKTSQGHHSQIVKTK